MTEQECRGMVPIECQSSPCRSSSLGKSVPKHTELSAGTGFLRARLTDTPCAGFFSPSAAKPCLLQEPWTAPRAICLLPDVLPVLPAGQFTHRMRELARNTRKLGQHMSFRHNFYQDSSWILIDHPLQKYVYQIYQHQPCLPSSSTALSGRPISSQTVLSRNHVLGHLSTASGRWNRSCRVRQLLQTHACRPCLGPRPRLLSPVGPTQGPHPRDTDFIVSEAQRLLITHVFSSAHPGLSAASQEV